MLGRVGVLSGNAGGKGGATGGGRGDIGRGEVETGSCGGTGGTTGEGWKTFRMRIWPMWDGEPVAGSTPRASLGAGRPGRQGVSSIECGPQPGWSRTVLPSFHVRDCRSG